RRRGYDPLHNTVFNHALLVKKDGRQIYNGLDLSIRLLTKDEKLAGNVNRSRNRGAFVRHVVIIRAEQYRQPPLGVCRCNRLAEFRRRGFNWRRLLLCDRWCRSRIEIEISFTHSHDELGMIEQLHLEISKPASLV